MTFRQVIIKMGSKINLNISNEWEPKVKPILEKWKKKKEILATKFVNQ